jgi:hypothetical protein
VEVEVEVVGGGGYLVFKAEVALGVLLLDVTILR